MTLAPPSVNHASSTQAWDNFTQAKTLTVFCQAWLQLLVQAIQGCRAAAVLIEDNGQFAPIAVWPAVSPELARLANVVERCLEQRKSVIQPTSQDNLVEVAYPVMLDQEIVCLVVLEVATSMQEAPALLRHIHWSSAWLSHIFSQKHHESATHSQAQQSTLLAAMAVCLQPSTLQQGLFDICNDLKQRLKAHKVAIALRHGSHLRLMALSEMASFEKNTPLAKAYVAAMEESMDVGHLVQLHTPNDETDIAALNTPNTPLNAQPHSLVLHQQLLELSKAGSVISCPLVSGTQHIGVLLCERDELTGFNTTEQDWLRAFVALLAPIIQQRQAAKRHSVSRLGGEIRALGQRLFGTGHLIWKTAASILLLSIVVLSVWHVDYRVSAKTVIEGEIQRVVSAPFAGFIAHSAARAGDNVKQGQPLAQLDDRELQLELLRWASERDQYDSKLREAIAEHKLSEVQVISAQRQQAQAQWDVVADKIARAQIKAPFEGVIIAGDLSQQIGAPVELGKELFTITPLTRYRVILQVDERDIRYIRAAQTGQLVMIGLAGEAINFHVHHLTAVANQADGKNYFRVEALLEGSSIRLRPGMEGIGKINTEKQSLGWVLFHPLWDWLSLMTWKWLP